MSVAAGSAAASVPRYDAGMIVPSESEALKRYLLGLKRANQLDLEERRRMTGVERMRQVCLWFDAAGLWGVRNLATIKRAQAEEEAFYKTWGAIQKAGCSARTTRRNRGAA